MLSGWIKIHRSILDWEWWDKPEMVVLFLYMLSSANVEETIWHGKVIKKGQFVTSLSSIERDNPKLTRKIIRTCLKRFQESGEISIESTNSHSVITICKYEEYSCTENVSVEEIKEDVQEELLDTPLVHQKNEYIKPKKTKEDLKDGTERRAKNFYNSLIPYVSTYGKEMVREFYDYWSEPNKSYSKLRFEQEKTWDLCRRLARWSNNNKGYKSNEDKNDKRNNDSAAKRVGEAANLVDSLLSAQG